MPKRKRPLPTPQEMLKLLDDHYTALYHHRNDPQRPPEFPDRICSLFRPADLPYAR
jgi:hypothetical protein